MAAQESRLAIVIDVGDAEARIRRLREQLRELGQQTDDTSRNTDDLGRRADRASRDTNRLSAAASTGKSALASMARAASLLGAAVGGIGAAAILATADSMQILNNQVRLATDGVAEYAIAQSEIERIAMGTFSSLESVGQMYASNERALSSLGKSQTEVLLFTENISKAMAVSGGSAEAQAAALTQLGQAMASGVLRGDEFNSIAEQAPVIMDLLTESLGVTRGELRAMAADGALTAEIVYDAVSGASGRLNGMMGETVVTMSNAMTNVKTQWALLADGLVNGEGGIGDGLASSIQKVALALQDARVWLDDFLNRAETIAFVEGVVDNIIALWGQLSAGIGAAYNAISEFVNSAGFITAVEMSAEGLKNVWDNLVSVIEKTAEVIAPVIDFFREHDKLSEALAISIGLVGGAFIIYNAAVIVGTAATAAFTAVLAFVTAPLTLIVVAMVALVAAGVYLYQNWDTIKAKAVEIWGSIKTYISNKVEETKQAMIDKFNAAKDAVINKFNELKTKAVNALNQTADSIVNALKSLPAKMLQIGKDIVMGLVNGIKSGASGVATAIGSMASSAVAKAKSVLDIRSPSRVMKKVGEQTAEGMAIGIKQGAKTVKSEAQKMAEGAIETVKNSIASLQKEIALFGNDSPLASFNFDVSMGKFAGVPDSLLDKNRELITQRMRLIELDKQQAESAKLLAKARESIQGRFAQLEKAKETSSDSLDKMLSGIEQETPMGKIQADYEQRLEVVRQFEQLHTDEVQKAAEARMAVEQSYQDAKRNLMLTQGEALFGDLAGLAKSFAGEQSGIYRALFAVEKGFAIAQSAIAIQQSIAKAMAVGFPANIPLIGAAVSQGASIMSSIKGIAPQGFKQGGYTGNMGTSQIAGAVHGQEYVFDAQSTKRIGVDNLNAMRRGDAPKGGGDVNINVVVDAKGNASVSGDNERMGRDMANGIKAVVMDVMRKEKRQGGLLYGT